MIRSFDSGEYYSKCHHIFKRRCNQDAEIVKMLQNYLPSQIEKLWASRDDNSELRILGVGSGTGEMDMKIVDIVAEELKREKEHQNMKIYARAIEPNAASRQMFREATRRLGNSPAKFDIRPETLEDYIQSEDDASFDIIHFIHSIYYVDAESAFLSCLEKQMKADGCLICVFSDDGLTVDILNEIAKVQRIDEVAEKSDSEYSENQTRRLISSIEKSGWKCKLVLNEYSLDVTDIIDSGGPAEDGDLLLDFLTNQVDFRQNAEPQLVENVLKKVKNKTMTKNGKRLCRNTDKFLIVHK